MMKTWTIIGAMLCLTTAGCGVIDFSPRSKVAQRADMSGYFAERLEVGRAHMEAGRPTKAIEAFRQASYSPDLAPEALNGMAVAYSTLGRDDVARDLFSRAIELDPTDQRYWRNLARVDERIMMARQAPPAEAPLAEAVEEAPAPALLAATLESAPQPRPARIAKAKEVFIRTLPAEQHPGITVLAKKRDGAIVRSPVMVVAQKSRSDYPIRVTMTPSRKMAAAPRQSAAGAAQPIRIILGKN